jgi:hypothetical protein
MIPAQRNELLGGMMRSHAILFRLVMAAGLWAVPAMAATSQPTTAPAEPAERRLVDEVLLGRSWVLRVFISDIPTKTPAGDPVAHQGPPGPRYRATLSLYTETPYKEMVSWPTTISHERVAPTARIVLADWADDDSLVVLYIAGQEVWVCRITFPQGQQPVASWQQLFWRGPGGGMVWDVVRAELVQTDEPLRLMLKVIFRGPDGRRTEVPVQYSPHDPDRRWTYDRRLVGALFPEHANPPKWPAREEKKE